MRLSLGKRLPTALVLLSLIFVTIQYAPRIVMFLFLQVFILAAIWEFFHLADRRKLAPRKSLGMLIALLISASFYWPSFSLGQALFLGLLAAAVVYVSSINVLEKLPSFSSSIAVTVFGALYLSFPLNYIYLIRAQKGAFALYFLFAVIFIGDSGAYFVGKPFGRRKMTPIASPHKTWEGSVAGLFSAGLGALAAQQLLLRDITLWKALLCGILVHAAAQVSDPLESLFKRAAGVKDSSNALPGHGGFLDRIDSFILAAPLFYYLVEFLWKP